MKNSLLFLLILCIALNSCEKESLEPINLGYIIAEDAMQSEYIAFNDTITGLKDIDFNSDDQLDFSLLPSYSAHCGSEVWNLSAYLLTYSNFEVITDSAIVVGAKTGTIISPRILSQGDRIYGWMKLKLAYWSSQNPVSIVLEDICYR